MKGPLEPTFDPRIADWLEDDPSLAPPEALVTVLAAFPSIDQRRARRTSWRLPRMDRLSIAASMAVAILALGAVTFGLSVLTRSALPGATDGLSPCPPMPLSEADAADTTTPGLTTAQRAWVTVFGRPPRPQGAGAIAAFWLDEATDRRFLITIDPQSGARCPLIEIPRRFAVQAPVGTALDWSPSGDALAVGLGDSEGGEGSVFLWTPTRLLRIWTGTGTPFLEWAPDGRRLAIWSEFGSDAGSETTIVHADGSPDRSFAIDPHLDGLRWSPDGSRWIVTRSVGVPVAGTSLALVDLADGGVTPLDIDGQAVTALGWADEERLVVLDSTAGAGGLLDVRLAEPRAASVVPIGDPSGSPDLALSSDGRSLAFLLDGALVIADLADASTTLVEVGGGRRIADVSLAWSPDGAQVLFHTGPDQSGDTVSYGLWAVRADGSEQRQILTGNVVAIDDPWQPLPDPGR